MQHPSLPCGLPGQRIWRAVGLLKVVRQRRPIQVAHHHCQRHRRRPGVSRAGQCDGLHARTVPVALLGVKLWCVHAVHQVVRHRIAKPVALGHPARQQQRLRVPVPGRDAVVRHGGVPPGLRGVGMGVVLVLHGDVRRRVAVKIARGYRGCGVWWHGVSASDGDDGVRHGAVPGGDDGGGDDGGGDDNGGGNDGGANANASGDDGGAG